MRSARRQCGRRLRRAHIGYVRRSMNDFSHSGPPTPRHDDPSPTVWKGIPASPAGATRARTELAAWLGSRGFLDGERICDVVLAVYEALANAVEASAVCGSATTMSVVHTVEQQRLTVSVVDRGRWRPRSPRPDPAGDGALRGRGIALMRALADHVRIDINDAATTVTLTWNDLTIAASDAA